jgi:hypothetical protein
MFFVYHYLFYESVTVAKNAKYLPLAPIEAKILVSRGSAHKIEMDSGTNVDKNAKSFCSKLIIELIF